MASLRLETISSSEMGRSLSQVALRQVSVAKAVLHIQYPHDSPRLLRTHQQISIRAASTSSKSIG